MGQFDSSQSILPATFPALAEKGRHSWWRYLLTVIIAFAVQTLVIILGGIALVATGFPPGKLMTAVQDPSQPILFFSTIGLSFAGLLIGFIIGGVWLHKKTFADYIGSWTWGGFATGFGVWLVVLLIDVAIGYGLRPNGFHNSSAGFIPAVAAITCVSLAIQTFTEEFIFRGYITQGLLKIIRRPIPTAIVSGLIFGACHIPNGLYQAASATLLGVALALVAIRTGSLAIGYGLHLINNVFGAVIVVSGGDVFKGAPGLIMQNTPDLNGVDLAVVAVSLLVLVVVTYRRTAKASS